MNFPILLLVVLLLAKNSVDGEHKNNFDGPPYYKCVKFIEDYCAELITTDDPYAEPELVGASLETNFNATTQIHFYLHTRKNKDQRQEIISGDSDSLRSSFFDDSKPTKVIIHGFTNSYKSRVNRKITEAYLTIADVNVIVVDWGAGCTRATPYHWAAHRTREVGAVVANFLHFLIIRSQVTIVGHSLGAHAAGFTGKNVKNFKIESIIGLDPAGPLFTGNESNDRLDASDASYVEAIHTNWRMFGFAAPLAKNDFYPNTGYIQPDCGIFCDAKSHSKAIDLFVESLVNNTNNFHVKLCPPTIDIRRNNGKDLIEQCNGTLHAKLGGDTFNKTDGEGGIYYFATDGKPKYPKGTFVKFNRLVIFITSLRKFVT